MEGEGADAVEEEEVVARTSSESLHRLVRGTRDVCRKPLGRKMPLDYGAVGPVN